MRKSIFLFFLLLSGMVSAQKGVISGRVVDATTGEALIGANIIVNELETIGAASDIGGFFTVNVPLGTYSVKVSLIGYQPVVKTDVVVKSGREAHVLIRLSETTLDMEEITVTAEYFDESIQDNDLSTVVLHAEEIRRSPGSSQDFQRILQGMAGVSFSNDQTNELLVRGGSPNENLTVFDGMEIHSTNHYPNNLNSGGPINMINVDLIQDIEFSTGGFISKYGDKLSSVLVVNTREGTRNRDFSTNANVSMAGYGAVMEGAIDGGKGSWIFSARNSFISLIAGSFGLTAVPYYYDLQGKAVYDLSNKHKLSLSGIYGNDRIDIEGVPDEENMKFAGMRDTTDVQAFYVKQYQYAAGLTLRSIWADNFYSNITLSKNNYNADLDVNWEYTEKIYDNSGDLTDDRVLNTRPVYYERSDDGETALRTEFVWKNSPSNEINFGGALKFIQFNYESGTIGDTVRYDFDRDGTFEQTVIQPDSKVNYDFEFFEHYKAYGYINDKITLFDERLEVNLGLRYDYFSYSEAAKFSPRASMSFYLVPQLTSLNLAYGEYFQTQALPLYGDRYQTGINRYLENTRSRHFVAGIEHILDDGLKLTVEGYYKDYSDIPFSEVLIYFNDRTYRSQKLVNTGEMESYGIDLLLQQKLVDDVYGTFSFSRMWTEVQDPRIGYEGNTFVSEFDFPYVVTAIIGKRFRNLRTELDNMPFFIKYPSYLLPFADDMEISIRYRFASGKPYTPQEYVPYEQMREGGNSWTEGAWVESNDIHGARYPDYQRMDLALNSRYNFNGWNMVVFLSVQNLMNTENIAFYQYNSDGTVDNVYQFAFLPVVGLEIEF